MARWARSARWCPWAIMKQPTASRCHHHFWPQSPDHLLEALALRPCPTTKRRKRSSETDAPSASWSWTQQNGDCLRMVGCVKKCLNLKSFWKPYAKGQPFRNHNCLYLKFWCMQNARDDQKWRHVPNKHYLSRIQMYRRCSLHMCPTVTLAESLLSWINLFFLPVQGVEVQSNLMFNQNTTNTMSCITSPRKGGWVYAFVFLRVLIVLNISVQQVIWNGLWWWLMLVRDVWHA